MNIPGNIPAKPAEISRTYQPQYAAPQAQRAEKADSIRRFDSVTISSEGGRSFEMDLRSRLSQEVRTATSSGQIAALRAQVQEGTYQVDVSAIAGKMLLLGEAV